MSTRVTEFALRSTATGVALCQISFEGVQCTSEAVTFWDAGCVHEHLTHLGLCAEHRERADKKWFCMPCREGDSPHECFVLIRQVAS